MTKDNFTCYFTGKVISPIKEGKKFASFLTDVNAPGGKMRILVKVAIDENFHLVIPEGSYIDVFAGEVYQTEKENPFDLAVYIRECKQINVCSPYRGEQNAEELVEDKKRTSA